MLIVIDFVTEAGLRLPKTLIDPYSRQTARHALKRYALALICTLPIVTSSVYLPVLTFGRDLSQRMTLRFISKLDTINQYWIVFVNPTPIFVSMAMFYVLFNMALGCTLWEKLFCRLFLVQRSG